jgi:hypothetical protein
LLVGWLVGIGGGGGQDDGGGSTKKTAAQSGGGAARFVAAEGDKCEVCAKRVYIAEKLEACALLLQ